MSQYNITLVVSGQVKVEAAEDPIQYGPDGRVFRVDVEGEPKFSLNGVEITRSDVGSEKYGDDGARAAALALLEVAYRKVQLDTKPPEDAAPTQPGAQA